MLSFTSWNGIGGLDRIKFVGIDNYRVLVTTYPPFWPAIQHNLIWLGVFLFIATPLGIFFAVLLDKEIRGTRFYQGALYLPVVLSLADHRVHHAAVPVDRPGPGERRAGDLRE